MSERSQSFNQIIASFNGMKLVKRVAEGGIVSCGGVDMAGWAHLGATLGVQNRRPVILITGKLKQQETLQQDLETWLRLLKSDTEARF